MPRITGTEWLSSSWQISPTVGGYQLTSPTTALGDLVPSNYEVGANLQYRDAANCRIRLAARLDVHYPLDMGGGTRNRAIVDDLCCINSDPAGAGWSFSFRSFTIMDADVITEAALQAA